MALKALTFGQAADVLSAVLGTGVRYVDLAPEDARRGVLDEGTPGWFIEDMILLFQAFSEGQGAIVTDVVRSIGRSEPRTFAEFARENVAAGSAHGSGDRCYWDRDVTTAVRTFHERRNRACNISPSSLWRSGRHGGSGG